MFTLLPSSYTGVDFANRLTETRNFNVFTYRNFYNGGGVAVGDLSGDGLPELMLTSNQGGPHLYLNLGQFRFRDITKDAGLAERDRWTTGVTLADVNGDGKLDIYVCHAGLQSGALRANTLYINQGVTDGIPRFREMAAAYGIADTGYSTQAAFFDYDGDGDLDMFLIRNSPRPVSTIAVKNQRTQRDPLGGHELYRNDGGHFVNVSEQAGIYGPEIGFGLGLAIGDVNRDGRPDVYVANDFFERDYLYINRGDGRFDEVLERAMPVSSYFSMGVDIADIDNNGWPDIYTADMLPVDDYRLKTTSAFEPWELYQVKEREGFDHQLMRNMLQRNNGDGTFSDVAWLAGVARTDWSWAALLADFDLDGNKDIFVANGLARDVTSQDYIAFLSNDQTLLAATHGGSQRVDFTKLINAMTSTKLPDYAFRNNGDLTFTDVSAAWGVDRPSFSNGAAYGDLDGDGAPDLVVNNVDDEAFVFRNNARAQLPENRFLQVQLVGPGGSANPFAVGARVTVRGGGAEFTQELEPTRGFQSSVDYTLTFGVGKVDTLESVIVDWPDRRSTIVSPVVSNQKITIREEKTQPAPRSGRSAPGRTTIVRDVTADVRLDFVHHENDFVDFDREPLMPHLLSTEGPIVTVGDVNGDGLDDFFIGGPKGQPSALYLQRPNGTFVATNKALFEQDQIAEDLGAAFFDADGNGTLDLYVVTGGTEFSDLAPALEDRLYLGDGRGSFRKATNALPPLFTSGKRVAVSGGGDLVFVGGRAVPGRYGVDPPSSLLRRGPGGRFTDVTAAMAPGGGLAHIGMVTDAVWVDVDGDHRDDLVVVGEWMPITIFHNTGTRLERAQVPGLEHSAGWWNRIIAADFTGDGRVDFILGNLGLNTRLHASPAEPARMYVKDFDGNGFPEQILARVADGVAYPLALRDELTTAMPGLTARYPKYADYARQTVQDIFGDGLTAALVKQVDTFASVLARNNGDGSFTLEPLPREAQLAPVYGILARDFDHDGKLDVLLAGNLAGVQPAFGAMMASYGLLLRGDGHGSFTSVRPQDSGCFVPGQARDIQRLRTRRGDLYIVARNNDRPLFFR